jgi:hypothetical protein
MPLLTVQLLDVLPLTTIGQMVSGGFLPSCGVRLWGMLAPLDALVFLEARARRSAGSSGSWRPS